MRYIAIVGVLLASMIGMGAAASFVEPDGGGDTTGANAAQEAALTTDATASTSDSATTKEATNTVATSTTETMVSATAEPTAAAQSNDDGSDGTGDSGASGDDAGESGDGGTGAETTTASPSTTETTGTASTSATTATPTTSSGSTGRTTPDAGRNCLPNPYDYDEEDAYEHDEYGLGMPDRFAEDILETDGVAALYYGMEGYQAGIVHYAEPEAGADPAVYCEVGGPEPYVFTEPERAEDEFTPHIARWTADPTYEKGMGISDQSVRWLLGRDHVERVEYAQSCTAPDAPCEGSVTVHVRGQYPPPEDEYAKQLPDRIDGHDVTYESVDGDS